MAHEATAPERVRNVVLVGHTGSGKTTLVEALLAATGAVSRPGSVAGRHDGHRLRRAGPQAAPVGVGRGGQLPSTPGIKLNLIDTPGHPDYVGELRAGLRAADAALFVVSAVDGLDGATALLWDECASVGMPRAVVVTKLDQPRADFEESVAVCQRVFGEGVVPLYLPLHDEGAAGADSDPVAGLIGLLSLQVYDYSGRTAAPQARDADPEHRELVEGTRSDLIEAIIQESEDDALMDRYLGGEEVGLEILVPDLERAVVARLVLPGAAGGRRRPAWACTSCWRSSPRASPRRWSTRCPRSPARTATRAARSAATRTARWSPR